MSNKREIASIYFSTGTYRGEGSVYASFWRHNADGAVQHMYTITDAARYDRMYRLIWKLSNKQIPGMFGEIFSVHPHPDRLSIDVAVRRTPVS